MAFTVTITPGAKQDVNAAFGWYREKSAKAASSFRSEVLAAFDLAERNPASWALWDEGVRRFLMKQFPYTVYFEIDGSLRLFAGPTTPAGSGWSGAQRLRRFRRPGVLRWACQAGRDDTAHSSCAKDEQRRMVRLAGCARVYRSGQLPSTGSVLVITHISDGQSFHFGHKNVAK